MFDLMSHVQVRICGAVERTFCQLLVEEEEEEEEDKKQLLRN